MTKTGDEWNCETPLEVGCHRSLESLDTTNIHIITESTSSVKIIPGIDQFLISDIHVWNRRQKAVLGHEGYWVDVTKFAGRYFKIDARNKNLVIGDLDMDVWKGQVVKITLSDIRERDCALAKFRGTIKYPFDVEKFKRSLVPSATTALPTTISTSTIVRTSTSIYTEITTMTKTKKTTTTSFATATEKISTAVTTTATTITNISTTMSRNATTPSFDKPDSSNFITIVLVIIGVVVVGLIGILLGFLYRHWTKSIRLITPERQN